MCTLSGSYVIYHKFSHGAAFYTLNGKNVNVMLESLDNVVSQKLYDYTCNNILARMCNVIDNVRVNNTFIEITFILKAIKSHVFNRILHF